MVRRTIVRLTLNAVIATAITLMVTYPARAFVNSCGPVTSTGNPFPCKNGGNCTFFAAYKANTVWGNGFSDLPSTRSAKYWADDARANGFPVSSEPGIYTIGVSSTLSADGHVAWVIEIAGSNVKVQEMHWGTYGVSERWRPVSTFNRGFIYPKSNGSRPSIWSTSPVWWNIRAGNYDQDIGVIGWNLYAPMIVEVTFPSGGRATLKDAQIRPDWYLPYMAGCYSCQGFWMRATLSARGYWQIKAVASNGQRSDPYWLYVY